MTGRLQTIMYAVMAYLLAANRVIPMTASFDSASLAAVRCRMPILR
jgi:hypothetical protein